MTLKVSIQNNKTVSLWCHYKDEDGNVLAEFKIRGSGYKPYKVALERANNQISSKGFDVVTARATDKLFPELLLECVACHLIEDWKGIVFHEENQDGELVEVEPECSPENAIKLLNQSDIGPIIWAFVNSESERIQKEADLYRDEVVGKSSSSINGASSDQKKKRTTTVKNKQPSQVH